MAKIPKLVVFTVKGTGPFPIDMLRYDGCWPYSSDDCSAVSNSLAMMYEEFSPEGRVARKITLTGYTEPTKERWKTFMWPVQ